MPVFWDVCSKNVFKAFVVVRSKEERVTHQSFFEYDNDKRPKWRLLLQTTHDQMSFLLPNWDKFDQPTMYECPC